METAELFLYFILFVNIITFVVLVLAARALKHGWVRRAVITMAVLSGISLVMQGLLALAINALRGFT